jgi:hypothetical protein
MKGLMVNRFILFNISNIETKIFVSTFSQKFVCVFSKNLLTKIDENDENVFESFR